MAGQRRKKIAGRSELARVAHFRTGAGTMGGTRKELARRRRRRTRLEEQKASRDTGDSAGGD